MPELRVRRARNLPMTDGARPSEKAAVWRRSGDLFVDSRLESLGVRHGTTTRTLGDMADPARRRDFFRSLGFKDEPGLWLKQVHGDRIVIHPEDGCGTPEAPLQADGWIAAAPSRPLCVYTADCAPLFLWGGGQGARPRFGGVFHVGWRGAAAGLPKKAVKALTAAFGGKASGLRASVGPHIRPCCFRVGAEVSSQFRKESVTEGKDGNFVDLGAEIAAQLAETGVDAGSVSVCTECTSCRSDLFYSYRKDKARESLLSFLGLTP
ncbi:MAG: polyphenol oxidase family protein [Elusimicrobia bacterium]|nr:polyphenol oxidase family protein [Elusimicrobiota bacterium]